MTGQNASALVQLPSLAPMAAVPALSPAMNGSGSKPRLATKPAMARK